MPADPNKEYRPPRLADRFFHWFCKPDLIDHLQGDLYEQFQEEVQNQGPSKAKVWYWKQVFLMLRPFALRKNPISDFLLYYGTHTRFALRQMRKHPLDALMNIGSLTLGIACFLFISLYVLEEFKWDRFHKDYKQIKRVAIDFVFTEGERIADATTPPALAPALKEQIPEVQASTRIFPSWGSRYLVELPSGKRFYEESLIRVDSTFFDVFHFPLLKSSGTTRITQPDQVMLSESMAEKYFGDENPLGKTIKVHLNDDTLGFKVIAILKDVPRHSHFDFDIVLPLNFSRGLDSWGWYNYYTYVRLYPKASPQYFESKLQPLYDSTQSVESNTNHIIYSQNLEDIHLQSHLKWELGNNGDLATVLMFGALGIFILLISLVNYMNLALSNGYKRHREIGMKKILGVGRTELFGQFMVETLTLVIIAFLLALFLSEFLALRFSDVLGWKISVFELGLLPLLLGLFALVVMLCLLGATFPSWQLSRLKLLHVFSGNLGEGKKNVQAVRGGLVILQFTLSIFMIIAALVVKDQLDLFRNAELGFNTEQTLVIPNAGSLNNQEQFLDAIRKVPGVEEVARSNGELGKLNWTTNLGIEDPILVNFIVIDPEYFKTLDIELAKGEYFSREIASQAEGWHMVLNEEAFKALNLKDGDIGRRIPLTTNADTLVKGRVLGVVKDFQFAGFKNGIKPFAFFWREGEMNYVNLKVASGDLNKTLEGIEQAWKQATNGTAIESYFLDQTFAQLYDTEQKLSKVLDGLTLIALFIAFFGMFAMAHLWLKARLKEVAVRKVLGARILAIVLLLSRPFLLLFLVANALAYLCAWFALNGWLESYILRIDLSWFYFALAAVVSLLVAVFTVGFQSLRLATQNPTRFLSGE